MQHNVSHLWFKFLKKIFSLFKGKIVANARIYSIAEYKFKTLPIAKLSLFIYTYLFIQHYINPSSTVNACFFSACFFLLMHILRLYIYYTHYKQHVLLKWIFSAFMVILVLSYYKRLNNGTPFLDACTRLYMKWYMYEKRVVHSFKRLRKLFRNWSIVKPQ